MRQEFLDNEEVLAAYSEALGLCKSLNLNETMQELQHVIEELKKEWVRNINQVKADLAYQQFRVTVLQAELKAGLSREKLFERWVADANEFAKRIEPTLLWNATVKHDGEQSVNLHGMDVLFAFRNYLKAAQKPKVYRMEAQTAHRIGPK